MAEQTAPGQTSTGSTTTGQTPKGQTSGQRSGRSAGGHSDPKTDQTAQHPLHPSQHPKAGNHGNHGNTMAAWVTVGLSMLGALVMCIAVVVAQVWVFVVGMVIVAIGLVAGKLLARSGHGMPRPDDDTVTRGVR